MSCQGDATDEFDGHATVYPNKERYLELFLDDHGDDVYLVEYADEEGDHELLAWRVTVNQEGGTPPASAPVLACEVLPPGSGTVRIPFADVEAVRAGDPPGETCRVTADSELDAARTVAAMAADSPMLVATADLAELLETTDPAVRERTLRALRQVARRRPGDCMAMLERMGEFVDEPPHSGAALATLAGMAQCHPAAVADYAPSVAAALTDEGGGRGDAARCLAAVADADPPAVVDAVPQLDSVLADRGEGLPFAVLALKRVADEYPSQVRPAAGTLGAVAADASLEDGLRVNVMATLGRVTHEFPDAALEAVEDAVGLLGAEDHRLRANGAALLCDAAIADADVSRPYVAQLEVLLTADDDHAVANASGALSRLAHADTETVVHLQDQFVELLDHDHERVRRNACVAVGFLGPDDAAETLERLAANDPVEYVRKQARWALERVR